MDEETDAHYVHLLKLLIEPVTVTGAAAASDAGMGERGTR